MTDKLLDFVGKRKESIEQKRRNFERILFQNVLGAYSELDQNGTIYPVKLVDISHDGCLFQVPWNPKKDAKFENGLDLTVRMYFMKNSFIPALCKVKYSKEFIDKDGLTYMHYGCTFDKTTHSWEAMDAFIQFLYKFAEHSTVDKAEKKVFFL